jgi:hypothetical protein
MQKVRRAMGVMLGVSLWIKFKLNTRVHGLLIYTAKAKKKAQCQKKVKNKNIQLQSNIKKPPSVLL